MIERGDRHWGTDDKSYNIENTEIEIVDKAKDDTG